MAGAHTVMKFVVSRTSERHKQPCEEAKRVTIVRHDVRTKARPEDCAAYGGETDWWYGEGRNHRVVNGQITRDFDQTVWMVDIRSLDQLLAFKAKYGELILGTCQDNLTYESIEIYDDYRE